MQVEVGSATSRSSVVRTGWSLVLLLTASACALAAPATDVLAVLVAAVWLGTAAVVLLAGPTSRTTGWIGSTFLAQALSVTVGAALLGSPWALAGRVVQAGALCLAVMLVAVFPDGRFVPRWAVGLFAAFAAWQAVTVVVPPSTGSVADVLGGVGYFVALAAAVGGQGYRYRRVSDAAQRRRTTWLVYGLAVSLLLDLGTSLPYFAPGWFPGLVAAGSPYDRFQDVVATLAVAVIPVCVAIAVVREQLFDIDVLIGRTLVYAALTLVVAAVYLAVVAGAGALIDGHGDAVLPLVAAAAVAVVFQPLRVELQRRVRRLLYGMQDKPYAALAALGHRLAATLPGEDVEARVVTTVRDTLRVPYVAIALRGDDGYAITRQVGTPTGDRLTLPLLHQGEEVGLLLVDDEPGGRLTAPGRALLADLARQAGPAIHGVRLTASLRSTAEQLQVARERLVVAGEEERRRLRRDLHDELAPTLAAAGLTAATATDLVSRDPGAAVRVLDRLHRGLAAAVADVHRLVDELRPVLLDEHGLEGAVRERAEALRSRLEVAVDVPAPLPALPAAVEVAAYRICQEALMNVLKHAAATTAVVRLGAAAGFLEVDVSDDGGGDAGTPVSGHGVGLASMRERAAELGGTCRVDARHAHGTRVSVRLPLEPGGGS